MEDRHLDEDKRDESRRASVQIQATIRQLDLNSFPVLLKDLSATGFKISCAANLNMDEPLLVKLPGLETLSVRIMWKSDMNYGCKFARELYQPVFEHIVKQAQST